MTTPGIIFCVEEFLDSYATFNNLGGEILNGKQVSLWSFIKSREKHAEDGEIALEIFARVLFFNSTLPQQHPLRLGRA